MKTMNGLYQKMKKAGVMMTIFLRLSVTSQLYKIFLKNVMSGAGIGLLILMIGYHFQNEIVISEIESNMILRKN
jgi:hypothetical protein